MPKLISSSLFHLIHSMSKAEKRHFKLYSRYHSKNINEMNYLLLFDIIAKQREYNEEKIALHLGGIKKEHLPALKYYLQNLILESLLALRSKGNDIDSKLSNLLEIARIMLDKGLVQEEMKFLERAKEMALRHERWATVLEVLQIEMREKKDNVKLVQGLEKEMEVLLDKLNNLTEYRRINREVFTLLAKSGPQRVAENKVLQATLNRPILRDVREGKTTEAKRLFYATFIDYYFIVGDFRSAEKKLIQLMHLIESNYSALKFPELTYSSNLNRLSIAQCESGKYAEALSTIQKHRSLLTKSEPVRTHVFIYSYLNETNYYLLTKEFKKGVAIIKDIEKELNKFKSEILNTSLGALYFNIANLYFGIGEYHKSLTWINKVINAKLTLREDMQAWARILQLLIHYELNTPDILEYLLVSTYRFLRKKALMYKVEGSILRFIRRLGKIDFPRQSRDALQKELLKEFSIFRNELVKITKDPEEKKALLYIDLISWLESKIENKSFAEIVKRKINKAA